MGDLRSGGMGGGKLEYREYSAPPGFQPRVLRSTTEGIKAIPTIKKLEPGEEVKHHDLRIMNIAGSMITLNTQGEISFQDNCAKEITVVGPESTDAQVIYQASE